MPSCVFVHVFVFVVVVVLCCYVVKIGEAKKTSQKSGSTSGHFTRQVMVACAKVIAFLLGCFVVFPCCSKTLSK